MQTWPRIREGVIEGFHVVFDWGNKIKPSTLQRRAEAKENRLRIDAKYDALNAEKAHAKAMMVATPPAVADPGQFTARPYVPNYQHDYLLWSGEEDEIRGVVRRMVVGASGRLTGEKIQGAAKAVWSRDQQWKDRPRWRDTLIEELMGRHPECFDGRAPDARVRKPSGKAAAAGSGCLVIFAIGLAPIVAGTAWLLGGG